MDTPSIEQARIVFFFPGKRRWLVLFYLFCLGVSFLLHWLLAATTPDRWWVTEPLPPRDKKELMVEMLTEEQVLPEWRYFESNPAVPSQPQDEETPLISDKDQQSAQLELVEELDELLPAMEGDNEDSNKLTSGDVINQQELLEMFQEEQALPEQLAGGGGAPLPDSPLQSDAEAGEHAGGLENPSEQESEVQEVQDLPENQVVVLGPQHAQIPGEGQGVSVVELQENQPRQPRPRPRLQAASLPGPLLSSRRGSQRIGAVTANTRFHEFGDYMSRMIETIGHQWYSLVEDTFRSSSMATGTVKVQFILNKDGEVEKLEILEQNGVNRQAVLVCQDAVMAISPFTSWSEAMVSLLGDSQEITINFIYGP